MEIWNRNPKQSEFSNLMLCLFLWESRGKQDQPTQPTSQARRARSQTPDHCQSLLPLSLFSSFRPNQTNPPTGPDRPCFVQPWLPRSTPLELDGIPGGERGSRPQRGTAAKEPATLRQAGSGGGMGQAIRKLFDSFFSTREMRVIMISPSVPLSSALFLGLIACSCRCR